MEITLGHVWYYMMYLSDNNTIKFWGWIDMLLNTHSMIFVYLTVYIVVTSLSFYLFKSFGFKNSNSFIIGIILSYFVFFNVIAKQSGDITQYSFQYANQAYLADKNSFAGYEAFIINK